MAERQRGPVRSRATLRLLLAIAILATLVAGVPRADSARAQTSPTREHGYIAMADGVRLKYTVLLPDGPGPFPVLMQYEGYNAGSFPDRANTSFVEESLAAGYAVLGVSVRGSACSGGVFDVFDPIWGEDGAAAVEWAADQPWSNGRIGMFSLSFGGIMQLWTAANQPEHLVAIAPGQVVADTYRDVGYPGGILNVTFPAVWMAALHQEWVAPAPLATQEGDAECLANIAAHPALNAPTNFGIQGLQHPYDDEWHDERSVDRLLDRIDVPVLAMQSWQDEQTGPRGGHHLDALDRERTWLVSANGPHGIYGSSPRFRSMLRSYFDHHLLGADNDFDSVPRVQVWHEMSIETHDPAWITTEPRWPRETTPLRLQLTSDNQLRDATPVDPGTVTTALVPGPAVVWDVGLGTTTWSATPGTSLGPAFTTAALPEDLTFVGSASADLWITSPVPDADLQVTITEVRPDGQETYVQRGWLRLSHRALDEAQATELRPWHPHTEAAVADLPADEPTLARLEVLPFAHTFRADSAVRMWIEGPSTTGLWGFLAPGTAAPITIHTGPDHPSALVLGYQPGTARAPLPACNTLLAQPCRANTIPVPGGVGPSAPGPTTKPDAPAATADADTASAADVTSVVTSGGSPGTLPATGASNGLAPGTAALLTGLLALAIRRRRPWCTGRAVRGHR